MKQISQSKTDTKRNVEAIIDRFTLLKVKKI